MRTHLRATGGGKTAALICDETRSPVLCSFIALPSSRATASESNDSPTIRPESVHRHDEQSQSGCVRDQSDAGSDRERQEGAEHAGQCKEHRNPEVLVG